MVRLERIRTIAKEKRVQLKEIAENIEITPAGMQHILKCNNTSVTTLLRISNFLKVPISSFFDQDPEITDKPTIDDKTNSKDQITPCTEKDSLLSDIDALRHQIDCLATRVLKYENK